MLSTVWLLKCASKIHVNDFTVISFCMFQNSIIVTGCTDGLVRVYDSRTGQCLKYEIYLICWTFNLLACRHCVLGRSMDTQAQ